MGVFEDAYARVIVEHALAVGPGHELLIESPLGGEQLCEAVHRHAIAAGAHPFVRLLPDDWIESRIECASDDVVGRTDWLVEVAYRRVDRRLIVQAPANTRATAALDPARVAAYERGRSRGMKTLIARDEAGEARWCSAVYPTAALAQEAGASLDGYRDLVARAMRLDEPDPVAAWQRASVRQAAICARLERVGELRVVAPGTDLLLGVGGRRWISSAGRRNLPDGEVFTGPHEDRTEGVVTFTVPATWGARETRGVRLVFRAGRCVEASAEAGEALLLAALDSDPGARTLGELAFGLNEGVERPTGNTLLDEKMGGSVHMALGSAYPATGGRNVSDLHWDLILDMRAGGRVYADGEVVYRDGAFLDEWVTAR